MESKKMKRNTVKLLAAILAGGLLVGALPAQDQKAPQKIPFFVYKDANAMENHYIPSGFIGDYSSVQMNVSCTETPKEGKTCLKFNYTAKPTQGMKWAGVYFQNPANNWGTQDGGYDITGAKKLKFAARGDKGGEIVEFKMGGINGTAYSDSDGASSGPITLTKEWKEFEIDLQGHDLSYIIGGFVWAARAEDNPDGAVFYLDEIAYVN